MSCWDGGGLFDWRSSTGCVMLSARWSSISRPTPLTARRNGVRRCNRVTMPRPPTALTHRGLTKHL